MSLAEPDAAATPHPSGASSFTDLCLLVEDPVVEWHRTLVEQGRLEDDPEQSRMVARLQEFSKDAAMRLSKGEDNSGKPSWLRRLVAGLRSNGAEPAGPQGLYVHGSVGTGKSMLMDAFFLQTPVNRKIRVHFHSFMQRLHREMKQLEGEGDPLALLASRIAGRHRLICFDEFHVSDIADAMILHRLLDLLLASGVRFVMTSNYAPRELYPNGLARDRFLPAIGLIESRMEALALETGQDYRLRQLTKGRVYVHPLGEESDRALRQAFDRLANGISVRPGVKVNGREIPAVARTTGAIWFDFDTLCGTARSQADYLELADRFSTILLSGIPPMSGDTGRDRARRFTLLVDVLYDARVKLICSAALPLGRLYGDSEGGESGRTLSRLREMQSREYLGQPLTGHATDLA